MSELTTDAVIAMMDKRYTLVYLERENNLDNSIEVLSECVKQKSVEPLYDHINDWFLDCEEDAVVAIIDGLKSDCEELGYSEEYVEEFFDTNDDAIRTEIYNRDDADRFDTLVSNTSLLPIRVELHSNYDCINSHYFEGSYLYKDSYFGDMVDALNLNPAKVQEVFGENGIKCEGDYPNLIERNGLEVVSYMDFAREIANSVTPANLLTFTAMIDVSHLSEHNFSLGSVTIPKGNFCGLYSPSQGGGSIMEMELLKDLTLKIGAEGYDYYSLKFDGDTQVSHSMKDVYGLLDTAFGKHINIVDTKAA